MSSILKALRRLEEERARKSHVAPEIAASLLRGDSRRQKTSLWIWPSLFAFVVLVLAVFFWSWRPVALTSSIDSPTASPPATIPLTAPAGRGGEVIIEEVMDQSRPTFLPPVTPTSQPVVVHPSPPRLESTVPTPVVVNKPATVVIEERQRPVVSAIAWQEDSSARMAVVDGLPVMTGESVAAAKVVEISSDRILFEEAGMRFSVRVQSQ